MKIHWHKRASAQLHQVEEYVLRDFGEPNYLSRLSNARSASRRVTLAIARTTTA